MARGYLGILCIGWIFQGMLTTRCVNHSPERIGTAATRAGQLQGSYTARPGSLTSRTGTAFYQR